MVLILVLTSKGMAGVPGSGFLALSATAAAHGVIPVGAVALLLGVDRIMDAMGVATNLLGNRVAVFAVSRWEGALDRPRARQVLAGVLPFVPERDGPDPEQAEERAEPVPERAGSAARKATPEPTVPVG